MDIKQRIETFNKGNAPWYIVEHDNGQYSLCLPLDLLSDEYYPYCQDAFDAYAAEIGEPAYSKNGLSTHGSGYEWEAAFREAFKDDPNIRRILFDCEAGGFFCYAYIQLCLAISHQALVQRGASRIKTQPENEKYTFRTWLLRLGLIGDEFKTARRHLLKNLEGNIAWRDPAQAEAQKARLAAKRLAEQQAEEQQTVEEQSAAQPDEQEQAAPAFSMQM